MASRPARWKGDISGGVENDQAEEAEPEEEGAEEAKEEGEEEEHTENEDEAGSRHKRNIRKNVQDFEYLVGMPISSLTAEKIEELMKQRETKSSELETLRSKSRETLWLDDLEVLEKALWDRDEQRKQDEKEDAAKVAKLREKFEKEAAKGKPAAKQRGLKRAVTEDDKKASSAPTTSKKKWASEEADGSSGATEGKGRGQKRKP